jgi:hypothetical protein
LAWAFGDTTASTPARSPWREFLTQLLSIAKWGLGIAAVFYIAISAIVFCIDLSSGVPVTETFGRLISNAPFVLLVIATSLGFVLLFTTAIVLAGMLLEKTRWKAHFHGRDYTEFVVIIGSIFVLLTVLTIFDGKWGTISSR